LKEESDAMKKPSTASLRYIALLLGTVGLLWSTSILHADPRQWGPPGIPIRQGHHIEWQRAAYTDANGYTLLVWSDTRTGDRDVYAELIEPDGDVAPGWPVDVVVWPYRQEDPEPIVTNGGFIVTWIDFRHDSTGDVFAQKLDYSGNKLWAPAGVIVDTNVTSMVNETTMRGATDGSGGAIIAWEDNRNGDVADIFAQRLNSGRFDCRRMDCGRSACCNEQSRYSGRYHRRYRRSRKFDCRLERQP
jgi:hypothetical protein